MLFKSIYPLYIIVISWVTHDWWWFFRKTIYALNMNQSGLMWYQVSSTHHQQLWLICNEWKYAPTAKSQSELGKFVDQHFRFPVRKCVIISPTYTLDLLFTLFASDTFTFLWSMENEGLSNHFRSNKMISHWLKNLSKGAHRIHRSLSNLRSCSS